MLRQKRFQPPFGRGSASLFLNALYFAISSLTESPQHALDFFWQIH